MTQERPIALFVSDPAVLSSLMFALTVDGLTIFDGDKADTVSILGAAKLVIDRKTVRDGLATLREVRASGCSAPAVVLVTNPTTRQRAAVLAAGASLVEKPLLGDELASALGTAHILERAA